MTDNNCQWISLHRTSNIIDNIWKKKESCFSILNENDSISVNLIPKKQFKGEYHIVERDKILNAIYFSDLVCSLLEPHIDENTIVGMEGLSFGSSGNSLIDISMTTALVRAFIVKKIDPSNFFVISPTSIKKFALKGNSKKDELYLKLLEEKGEEARLSPLLNLLKENRETWIKGSNNVETPCSDLVDATWISLFVEENLEKLLSGKKV